MAKPLKVLIYLLAFLIVLCSIRVVQILVVNDVDKDLLIGSVADIITACTAICACLYSYVEYTDYKKKDEMDAFAHYSERYSKDKNIKVVSEYLIDFLEHENPSIEMPSIFEKEMFLRFFEELELQIEQGRISQDNVQKFFVYYAVAAAMCEPFVENTELVNGRDNNEVWSNYRKLIRRFSTMEDGINKDYLKNHNNKPGLKILVDL